MSVRRIVDLDFDEIKRWFGMREFRFPDKSIFPKTGFIVDGVAAGFIYFTDSSVAIIDFYISNPDTDPDTRSDALNAVTEALIKSAIFNRCKIIKCDTKLEAVRQRALDHGFDALGTYESFMMEI